MYQQYCHRAIKTFSPINHARGRKSLCFDFILTIIAQYTIMHLILREYHLFVAHII